MEQYILIISIIITIVLAIYFWTNRSGYGENNSEVKVEQEAVKMLLPLKIQAYERLVLFLERNKPTSLVTRLLPAVSSSRELKILLLNTISEELEHNYSQQIYVSEPLWQHILLTKEKLHIIINKAATELQADTPQALAQQFLLEYAKEDTDFIATTLLLLRNEARMLQQ